MSSIDPHATKALAAWAAEMGLRWGDSPLSGGPQKALTGEFTLMARGKVADVEEAHNVLKHLSSTYTPMGPSGGGLATELINQVLRGLGFMVIAEATQLVIDSGIDVAKIPKALRGGRQRTLAGMHASLCCQRLRSRRAHRLHDKGPRRHNGSRTAEKWRNATHCSLRRNSPVAHRGWDGRRGQGSANGVLQRSRKWSCCNDRGHRDSCVAIEVSRLMRLAPTPSTGSQCWLQPSGKRKAQFAFDRSCVERVPECPVIHVITSRDADPWMVRFSSYAASVQGSGQECLRQPCQWSHLPQSCRAWHHCGVLRGSLRPDGASAGPGPFVPSVRAIDGSSPQGTKPEPTVNDRNNL